MPTIPKPRFLGGAVALILSLSLALPAFGGGGETSRDKVQTMSSAAPSAGVLSASASSSDARVGGFWYAIGGIPSGTDLTRAARRYDVVVLNAWNLAAKAALKSANPDITVLVYKDLASTRGYAVHDGRDDALLPTGVGYVEAPSSWFATDTGGHRIEWAGYSAHWQMKVWDPGYRARWVSNVVAEAEANGWDGVFADNDMATLRWYSQALLAGTSSRGETDQLVTSGLRALVREAGSALNGAGKTFVPNHSDGRLDLDGWRAAASHGGAMDEQFAHWGWESGEGFITDWGSTGWRDQTAELDTDLTLLVTHAAVGDRQPLRYGYGSALVRAEGPVAWTPDTDWGSYETPGWFGWQRVRLGSPRESGVERSTGVWVRHFERGFVAVNPHSDRRRVALPSGLCTRGGKPAGRRTWVSGHDAKLFKRC